MEKQLYYIGTYTEPILFGTGQWFHGKGEGIHFAEFDAQTGCLELTGVKGEVRNPSYLAVSPDKTYLAAVNELKAYRGETGGSVSLFQIAEDGRELTLLDEQPTHGTDPCHVAFVGEGRIVVSNFMSGSICTYRIEGGKLIETAFCQHEGSSADPARQTGPHAHSCIPTGADSFLIPDLGIDTLMAYRFDEKDAAVLDEQGSFQCPPGFGPRYAEFNSKGTVLYVIGELASQIMVCAFDRECGTLERRQVIDTIDAKEGNICADLHITGDDRFVYASNRGHDSITVFEILEDGTLRQIQNIPCGGKTPRNFAISRDENYLLVGNQDTDSVVVFRRDRESGLLAEHARTDAPTPVCIRAY